MSGETKQTSSKDQAARIRKVPIESILSSFDGARVITDCWWCVLDEHVMFHRQAGTPQCNSIKDIACRVGQKLYPGCEIRFIAVAYVEDEP